jgi:peptidoglycan hydrolase-like protein with peptidoglycan-binding domain
MTAPLETETRVFNNPNCPISEIIVREQLPKGGWDWEIKYRNGQRRAFDGRPIVNWTNMDCADIVREFSPLPASTPTPDKPPAAESRHGAVRIGIITIHQAKELLMSKGFYKGPVDDTDDDSFIAAIRKFQDAEGLMKDGLLGPVTARKLMSPSQPPTPTPQKRER